MASRRRRWLLFMLVALCFGQGGRFQNLDERKPKMARWRHTVNYRNTGGHRSGFARCDDLAVRWTGRLRIFRTSHYRFSYIYGDGSKLWVSKRYSIKNDVARWRHTVKSSITGGRWSGFARVSNFVVRWAGRLRILGTERYRFSITSDRVTQAA